MNKSRRIRKNTRRLNRDDFVIHRTWDAQAQILRSLKSPEGLSLIGRSLCSGDTRNLASRWKPP
jgi:hypothetical protein